MHRLLRSPRSWTWRLAGVSVALCVMLAGLALWRVQSLRAGLQTQLARRLGSASGLRARIAEVEPDLRHGSLLARGVTLDEGGRTLLRAQELRARFALGALLHAELDLQSVELVSAELTLNLADLRRLRQAAANAGGLDSVRIRRAKFSVELPALGWVELSDAQLELSGRHVSISGAHAVYKHGTAHASAERLRLTAALGEPREPAGGRLRLERVRWMDRTLGEPLELGWIVGERAVRLDASLEAAGVHATAQATLDATGLALDAIHVTLPHGQLAGRAHITQAERLELALTGRELEVSEIAQCCGVALSGRGLLELQAHGRLDAPEWHAHAELTHAVLGSMQLGRLAIDVALDADGMLHIERADSAGPDWQLLVEPSSLRLDAGLAAAHVSLRSVRFPLTELYRVLGAADDPTLAHLQARASGRVELVYERSAGDRTLDLGLALQLDAVSLAGYRFDRGQLQAHVVIPTGAHGLAAGTLSLKQMALSAGTGALEISGEMQRGRLAMQIALHALPLARVPWLPTQGSVLSGRMLGKGTFSGASAQPRAELALSLDDVRLFGRPLGHLQLRSQLRAAGDSRSAAALACPRLQTSAVARGLGSAAASDSAWSTCGAGLNGQLRVDLALGTSQERPVRGRVEFDRLALGAFLPTGPRGERVAGTLSGALEITAGGLAHPERLSGRLSVQKLELGQGDAALTSAAPFELRVNSGVLQLQAGVLQGPKQRFVLTAAGTLAEAGRLIADGSIKASLFTPAGSPLVQYFGSIPVHVEWQPGAQPTLRGRAELDQFLLQVGPAATLRVLRGALLLSDQRLQLEHLAADFGAGQLELDGQLALQGLQVASYALTLTARRVSLEPQPLVQLAFDADTRLSWTGGTAVPRLAGTVKLKRLLYGKQFHLEAIMARRAESRPAARDRLELDLTLEHEQPLRVRNSFADAELAISGPTRKLHIVGSDRKLGLLGQLAITRGRLLFQGDPFHVTHGEITLADPQRIAPSFDVRALAERPKRPDTRISFAARGSRDAFKVAISCDDSSANAAPPPFTCDYAREQMHCDSFEQLAALWVCRAPPSVLRQ